MSDDSGRPRVVGGTPHRIAVACNDLPNQITNFGGEKKAWGPLLLTNYGFDKRIHNFASKPAANPCG
jgi:hypothetical protein